jgi:hypothetical protein
MATKSKKCIFVLTSINITTINDKYNMNISFEDEVQKLKTTKLTDLEKNTINKNVEVFSFLDESKKTHKCIISMIDFKTKLNAKELNYNCFWDRNPIDGEPIGCPINYIPKQIQKTFFSHISKDTYFIRENVVSDSNIQDEGIVTLNNDYYETDGAFCSFECCLAFILDNKHNRMYDMSQMLLTKIYNKLNNTKAMTISPASSWRVLKEYGGHMPIEKLRSNFGKIDYDYSGYTQKCLPIAHLYEEKVKFF